MFAFQAGLCAHRLCDFSTDDVERVGARHRAWSDAAAAAHTRAWWLGYATARAMRVVALVLVVLVVLQR